MITEIVERVARRAIRDRKELRPPLHWGDFVVAEGLLDVSEASGDASYVDGARDIIDAYVDRGPEWGGNVSLWAGNGLPSLRLARITGARRYEEYGLAIADRLRNRVAKTKDGGISFGRDPASQPQLWVDILHFSCPTFCEAALYAGDDSYFEAAVEQLRVYAGHLIDEPTGLFYHIWDEQTDEHSSELWSRGMGWLTVACVEMLARLPESHPDRQFVIDTLTRQVESICELQDPTGLWHTVIDRPDSYLETSTAGIFGFPMVRGARLGILDRKYLGPAGHAWQAMKEKVSHDGLVFDVSTGTPPGDFDHYQNIARGVETYGTGFFLQLGAEMSRLATMPYELTEFMTAGRVPHRVGPGHYLGGPTYGAYATRDGDIVIEGDCG